MSGWIGKKRRWIDKPKRSKENITQAEKQPETYGIDYVCMRCPACNSKNVTCYNTKPIEDKTRRRYHSCRDCGHNFMSIEQIVDVDPGK